MPSTISSSVSRPFASSIVMTPSLPTLSIAAAIIADLAIVIGRDSPDLRDLGVGRNFFRNLLDLIDDGFDGHVDAPLQIHGIQSGGDRFRAPAHDSLRQYCGGRRAVADLVARFARDLLDHLRAHVLKPVGQFDLLGDRHAVFRNARRAVRFIEQDVAALRAEGHLHRIGENVDAAQQTVACVPVKSDFLGSHVRHPLCYAAFFWATDGSIRPMMSASFMIIRSSPSSLTSVPDHLPNSTRSPAFTSSGCSLPASSRVPGPTATTLPSIGFSCAVSGMKMPPIVLVSGSTRRIRTRSCNGRSFILGLHDPYFRELALSGDE